MRKNIVELCCDALHFRQPRSGNVGEVVVFHVVPHVEGQEVPHSVVRVGLVALCVHVVLGNEVSRHGVEPHCQESPGDEVEEGPPSEEVDDEGVKHHLDGDIQ